MKRHCCTWTIEVLHLRCRKTRGTGCVATWTWLVLHVAFRHPASTWCVWYGRCKCPAELLKQQLYIANLFAEMILLASSSLLFGVFLYFRRILISWRQHPLFSICQTVRYSRFTEHFHSERWIHYSYSVFGGWTGCPIELYRYFCFQFRNILPMLCDLMPRYGTWLHAKQRILGSSVYQRLVSEHHHISARWYKSCTPRTHNRFSIDLDLPGQIDPWSVWSS